MSHSQLGRQEKVFLQKCSKGMNVSGTVLGWKESIRHGGYLALKNVDGYQLRHKVFYWKCSTLLSSSLLLSAGKGELDKTRCRGCWEYRCSTCSRVSPNQLLLPLKQNLEAPYFTTSCFCFSRTGLHIWRPIHYWSKAWPTTRASLECSYQPIKMLLWVSLHGLWFTYNTRVRQL